MQERAARTVAELAELCGGTVVGDGSRSIVGPAGLEPLIELLMLNAQAWKRHWAGRLTLYFGNLLSWIRHLNPPGRARRNVAHHYDLTDELFNAFLDPCPRMNGTSCSAPELVCFRRAACRR